MNTRVLGLIILLIWGIGCKNRGQEIAFTPSGDPLLDTLSLRIISDPENAELYFARGERFIELKQPEQAMLDINKAISLDPDNSRYSLGLSDVYFQQGKISESRRILEELHSKTPEDVDVTLKLAEISLYFKEYPKTASLLDEAEKSDKRDPRIHFMRGFMLKDKGDTIAAVKSFFTTVEYDSAHFDAYIQLGILHAARKDRLAIEFYRKAHEIRPSNVEPLYNLGMFYQQTNDLNAAIMAYTDAIEIEPTFKYAHFALGYLHIELKIYSEAARHFSNAIKADPAYVEGYYGRGYSLEMAGDVMNAKLDYEKCLSLNPNHAGSREGLQRISRLPSL
jgi:tetratricopeptide (TPR) repeat protein